MRYALLISLLATSLIAAPDAVRLDFGNLSTLVQTGWAGWTPRGNDGFGPIRRKVDATSFAPAGFQITLGPKRAIGIRSAKPANSPRNALVMDSFFTPAQTPLTIDLAGLPKGEFRVVLWLNDARGYEWPPVTVLVNDAQGHERVAAKDVPQGSTGDAGQAGHADFAVFSDGAKPVHIATRIPVEPGTKQYVFACGLEILTAASARQASLPTPPDGTVELAPGPVRLSWLPARDAVTQRLFLGKRADALQLVATNPKGDRWRVDETAFGETLFWRVDTEHHDRKTTTGTVWRLAMETGQATSPAPANAARPVSAQTVLRWRLPRGAQRVDLWLGTDAAKLSKGPKGFEGNRWSPPALDRDTTYHWRVDCHHGDTVVTGPVWTFRTDRGGARQPIPANGELGVSADTPLRWTPGGRNARSTLLVGPDADHLQPVGGPVANGTHGLPMRFGQRVFWRVDEAYGSDVVTGPVWQFTVGDRYVVEDFEDYTFTNRLADTWFDNRANPPAGPLARLTEDGLAAMRVEPRGTVATVRRTFTPPRNWVACGADRLTVRLSSPVRLVVSDAAGRTASAELAPRDGMGTLPIAALGGVDLTAVSTLAFQSSVAVAIDDIQLAGPVAAGAPKPVLGDLGSVRGAPHPPAAPPVPARELRADVCVVGGGSGGIGAAVAAARAGATVLLVEREAILGGTSTAGYVINWEPGPGCDIAREIVDRLAQYENGRIITRARDYEGTLTRASNGRVEYEIEPFHEVCMAMLQETGRARVLLQTTFVLAAADREQKRVRWIDVVRNGERCRIRARSYVDCTGSGFLCQTVGCDAMLGADARSRFGEPSAPEKTHDILNALELCYRIRKSPNPVRQQLPEGRKPRRGGAGWPLPSGDMFINTCGGLAPGWLLMELGYEGARKELELRVQQHWNWIQKERYPDYEFDSYASMLAIRESHRILGEYVLREQDVLTHVSKTPHQDVIAIADHPMDTHGAKGGLGKVAAPYGIPYRCLVPKGPWKNLLVACRGASFSHLAASSCRLSRTIMALGHAAGLAAAESADRGVDVMEVDIPGIQAQLNMPPQ
jgi:hypothetical protein